MFEQVSKVTRVDPRQYRAKFDKSWLQNPAGVYGGLTAAVLLRALKAEAGELKVRSLTVQLAAPVPAEELAVVVTAESVGRTTAFFSARLARAAQPERVLAHAVATFAADRDDDFDEHRVPVPTLPPADSLKPFAPVPGVHPPFMQHFETRFSPTALPFSGATESRVSAWLRPSRPAPVDDALEAALLDVMPAAALSRATGPTRMASVSMTWHFLGDPAATHDGYWLVDATSHVTAAGFCDHEARLFSGDRCVAVCRQMFALLNAPT